MNWPQAFAIVGVAFAFVAFAWIVARTDSDESETSRIMAHYRDMDVRTGKQKDTTK